MPKADKLQGSLDLLILKVLSRRPNIHGYAIISAVREISVEVLQIEDGSLYPALNRMLVKGWLKAEWGISDNNRKARLYRLTPEGRKQLEKESNAFNKMIRAIRLVMRTS